MTIYMLRTRIAPAAWYYMERETVPEKVPFTSLYDAGSETLRTKIIHEETAALGELARLKEERVLSRLCQEHRIDYKKASYCLLKRVKEDGSRGYHQRPTYEIVKAFREVIHPDLWYIFPDELV
jgi:hypothetical protein